MNHLNIRHTCWLSLVLVACSGERPQFGTLDASTGTIDAGSSNDSDARAADSTSASAEPALDSSTSEQTGGTNELCIDVTHPTCASNTVDNDNDASVVVEAGATSAQGDKNSTGDDGEPSIDHEHDASLDGGNASDSDDEQADSGTVLTHEGSSDASTQDTSSDGATAPIGSTETGTDIDASNTNDAAFSAATSSLTTTAPSTTDGVTSAPVTTDQNSSAQSSNPTSTEATGSSSAATSTTANQNSSAPECIPAPRDCSSPDDNDCDGEPDNTIDDVCRCEPDETRECETHPNLDGHGICTAGSQTCVVDPEGGSDWDDCEGSVGPQEEVCTGNSDEDCDDEINEADACPCAADPCQNGGTCEADGSTYTCDCSQTDFAGDNCDEPRAITLPRGPGNSDCQAATLSSDGTVVGATCNERPAYWTASSGWQYLITPTGYFNGTLVDVSSNGQVFIASMRASEGDATSAVRWSSRNATGAVLPGGEGNTYVTDVSGDGNRTIGYGSDSGVLVWVGNAAATLYEAPDGANVVYSALDADGSTIWSSNSDGSELLRWTGANSRTGFPTADVTQLNVTGVSEDGQVVVGTGWPSTVVAAWRYADNQFTWLNSGGAVLCFSYGKISADGSRVAGWCLKPVVWFGDNQFDIQTYLAPIVDDLEADINSGSTRMQSMSADGRYAVGDDLTRVFLVRLPNP